MCSMWDANSDRDYYDSMLGVYPDDREPEEEEVNTAMEEVIINPAEHAQRLTTTLNRLRDADACADRYGHLVKALGGVSFDHDAPINLLTILEHNGTEDCLWALCATIENCDKVARLMAADFAAAVLPIFERERPIDSRPREAINAARLFALGNIEAAALSDARTGAWSAAREAERQTDARATAALAARDSARDSARYAAGAAAWYAALAAARDAAEAAAWARVAARDAAEAAARDAARDAAWSAAEAAAWSAARGAGYSAAWPAAREAARDAAGETQANIIRRYLKPCVI